MVPRKLYLLRTPSIPGIRTDNACSSTRQLSAPPTTGRRRLATTGDDNVAGYQTQPLLVHPRSLPRHSGTPVGSSNPRGSALFPSLITDRPHPDRAESPISPAIRPVYDASRLSPSQSSSPEPWRPSATRRPRTHDYELSVATAQETVTRPSPL